MEQNVHVYTIRVAAENDVDAVELLQRYARAGVVHKQALAEANPEIMQLVIVSQKRFLEMLKEDGLIEPHDIDPDKFVLTERGRQSQKARLS